jgi:hypothetical protein
MKFSKVSLVAALGLFALGCESGGVGDPCTPEDEYTQEFSGFSVGEVNVESRSFQCETRICLVNHFQGRVSCPYGQTQADIDGSPTGDEANRCRIPGTNGLPDEGAATNFNVVTVPVLAQTFARRADNAVYCSCRCDGDDETARYCECPSGYKCEELVKELGLANAQLAGSYCVRSGTTYSPTAPTGELCSPAGNTPDGSTEKTFCDPDKNGENP